MLQNDILEKSFLQFNFENFIHMSKEKILQVEKSHVSKEKMLLVDMSYVNIMDCSQKNH